MQGKMSSNLLWTVAKQKNNIFEPTRGHLPFPCCPLFALFLSYLHVCLKLFPLKQLCAIVKYIQYTLFFLFMQEVFFGDLKCRCNFNLIYTNSRNAFCYVEIWCSSVTHSIAISHHSHSINFVLTAAYQLHDTPTFHGMYYHCIPTLYCSYKSSIQERMERLTF